MNKKIIKTKDRIIEAAGFLFSHQSYASVTIQEICTKASCNIAAINYHFKNKENLYKHVFELATTVAAQTIKSSDSTLAVEQRLSDTINCRLDSIINPSPKNIFPQLIYQEMQTPSPIHSIIEEVYLKPRHAEMTELVKEFLGKSATPIEVRSATFSIHSQCAFLNIASQNHKGFWQEHSNDSVITEMNKLILGGLIHYKSQLEVNK